MEIYVDVRSAIGPLPGVKHYITNLTNQLARLGSPHRFHGLALKSLRHPVSPEDASRIGIPIVTPRLPTSLIYAWQGRNPQMRFDAFTRACDVYCLTDCYYLPILKKPRLVAVIHDLIFLRHPELYPAPGEFLAGLRAIESSAALVVASSEATRQDILELTGIHESRTRTVHLAADDIKAQTPHSVDSVLSQYKVQKPYYLFMGEMCPKKNVPRLIAAYHRARLVNQELPHLILCGREGADSARIAQVIREHHLEGLVRLTGYIPSDHLFALLQGAHALLYPSLYEGFGLPPLQAMQLGVPVMASNTGSLPEVLGNAALLVDPLSEEQMADLMLRLAADETLRGDLIERGKQRAAAFSWEQTALEMIRCYEDVAR